MDYSLPFIEMDDKFEKLVLRMNPPRVTIDNTSSRKSNLIKVDSANKYGSLLEVVQFLTDLNLTISRDYISSDGEWFMDEIPNEKERTPPPAKGETQVISKYMSRPLS